MDEELDQFKRASLWEYAASRGYLLVRREPTRCGGTRGSTASSLLMRHPTTDDIIVVRLDGDGHWIYFSVRDDRDNGTIIDFVQRRGARTLPQVREELRAWSGQVRTPRMPDDVGNLLVERRRDRAAIREAFARAKVLSNHLYLNSRGIRPETLSCERFAGTWRVDLRGDLLFPHFDGAGPEGICGFERKNPRFTGFAAGGTKTLWTSNARNDDEKLVFAEAVLDAFKEALRAAPQRGVGEIKLGIVAPSITDVDLVRGWLDRMAGLLVANEGNAKRFRNFPGSQSALGCRFVIPAEFVRVLDRTRYDNAFARISPSPRRDAFEDLLTLYSDAIQSLFGDLRPDCVLVCFPEEIAALRMMNPALSHKERSVLERLQEEDESDQLSLFEPTEEERGIAAELLPQAEELLFRNFHRALKARCMLLPNPVPLQVIRRHTYVSQEATQSDATRAWNLSVALYYKTGHIPWRPEGLTKGVCFIGVSFHHLKRRGGSLFYASVAQAFSSELEPFALRGASIPPNQVRDKRPYLNTSQASDLVREVVAEYERRCGAVPSAVVVHKTSRYQPEEEKGFRDGLLAGVAACHLVWFAPTGFRLLRHGVREPLRGTLCTLEDDSSYLFTTGFVPWWEEYPGPHIPAPLQIGVAQGGDLEERAREVLALTKMNWNSAEGIGRHPITLMFARKVGIVMSEIPEDVAPNPLYRFYM